MFYRWSAQTQGTREGHTVCTHQPLCPTAGSPDHGAAHTVAAHHEQGWSLLCNGVIAFDDSGELLPDGRAVAPVVHSRLLILAA
jgi:hypothetical protein